MALLGGGCHVLCTHRPGVGGCGCEWVGGWVVMMVMGAGATVPHGPRKRRVGIMGVYLASFAQSTMWDRMPLPATPAESSQSPEAPNMSQHRIPSNSQHPISMGTK